MSTDYFKIEPELSEDGVAYIEDWEFTYWPDKPKSEIVKNLDGSFSVIMEENFVPLVKQLRNLFKNGNAPESGTYLGEAVLRGKNVPQDCIGGNFINDRQGLVISNRLLEIIKRYRLTEHFIYELPLIKKRKRYNDYNYIFFKHSDDDFDLDVRFVKKNNSLKLCFSEELKEEISNSEVNGCKFTLMNEGT